MRPKWVQTFFVAIATNTDEHWVCRCLLFMHFVSKCPKWAPNAMSNFASDLR